MYDLRLKYLIESHREGRDYKPFTRLHDEVNKELKTIRKTLASNSELYNPDDIIEITNRIARLRQLRAVISYIVRHC